MFEEREEIVKKSIKGKNGRNKKKEDKDMS